DREKPICIGEDFYHGFHDQFFGLTKWGGDKIWHLDGYLEMWRDAVWMAADGYYDADLAGWNLWSAAEAAVTNRLFDGTCGGQLMPDYLISIREPYRNLYAGEVEKRTLTVYNKRFLDREVRLVREVLVADGTRPVAERADLPGKTMWRFTVPAGERHVMEVEVGVPDIQGGHSLRDGPRDRPETEMHRYTLFDAKTGERLFARDWIYNIFPKTAFAWPEGVVLLGAAVAGRHALPSGRSGDGSLAVTEVDAAMAAGRPIVVTKSLTTAEGLKLKKFVVEGGRVMIIEAKGPGWTPIPLIENKMQSFVFRREGGVMPEVDERMLACWRPDALVGSSGYVKPSDRTVEVMFDSGHQYGLTEMQIGRVWDGKGHWFLYQMPVGGRPDAAADFVLAAAVREFLKGPKALDRHLTLKADDPLCEVFRANKILFDTREDAKSVHLADLDPTDPEQRKGLSNEDRYLSVAKLGDVKFRFENTGMVSPKWKPVDAVRTNFDWAVDMKLHPRKTQTVLRTMLRNLGVNAAEPAPETVESPIGLGKFVNRPVWNDPRLGGGVTAWFGEEDDMRYFPVNLCGWSRDSGNHCPVESVPAEAINFAGYPFRISQGTFDGVEMPGSIVLEPGEKKRLKVWQKNVKMFRFLGALRKHVSAGEALKIAYGYVNHSRFEDVVKAGDALNGYRWAGAIDNGKVGWTGFSKEEAAAVLYVWHVPAKRLGPLAGYTNFVELENVGTSAIAIVGMTLENLP
ncbi:MAG: hypothetical protein RBT78_07315, partial [Kiritimatiellia bacterium]|nr:hypothetical protein [Kiritimatiellia bacterium]